MKGKSRGIISNSKKFIYFKALCRQLLHFTLIFSIIFQNTVVFSQSSSDLQSTETETLQSIHFTPIQYYDSSVPLTVNPGSFAVAAGQYSTPPTPEEHYIARTKLGYSIYKLQDTEFMTEDIYQLHNALISKMRAIEIKKGEEAHAYLTRVTGTKRTPQVVNNIGTAELSKVDGKFLIRVIHHQTDTVFYILDEADFSEDNYYLKKLQARQHLMGGNSRLDGQKGRDIIYLWKNGTRNTRTVISPRIEVDIKSATASPNILPVYKDSTTFKQLRKQHKQLHRQEYWDAIASKPTMNNMAFALTAASIQGALALLVGASKEFISGENVDVSDITLLSFFFTLFIYLFPSSYRYWINMGNVGFLQKKSNIAHTTSFLEQFKEIDWKETLKSKAARSGLTSLLYSYIFLFMTNEQVTNLDILDINNLPIFIHLFLLAQLIALPNLIINNSSKVWWTEQAQVNEIAGVTNKDVSIPFLPFIKWNLANIDYAFIKYNASQIAKLTHLLSFGLPAAFTATAASIGINLSTLGINAGLFTMIGSIWLGQYFLLKQVLNFHQKKYLDNEQTWHYIDRITQSRLGQLFLKTESLRRKFLLRWHKFHIQSPKLMNDFYKVLGLVSLTEIGSETAITKRDERRFEKWAHHNDVVSHIESEIDFYEHSQQITKSLRDLQFNFLQYIVQKSNSDGQFASERILTNTFKRQVMVSFNNFAKVVHALFETLKARYSFNEENLSQEESFYSDIWERNKTIEQDDIMDFFEEHLTEKFPHLQQALNFLKDEKFVPSETTEELVALEEVLKEFQVFMENHFEYLLGYIDEQKTKNFTYQSGSIVDENTESHFNYSFEKKLRTAASIISSGSAPIESPTYLCAGALEKNR